MFGYCCQMFRHLLIVPLSALIGSFAGTAIWVFYEGGTGAPDALGFFLAISVTTLMFTIPGAILLMATSFALAHRDVRQLQAFVAVIVIGALAGAAMLALFSPYFVALGAMYGCLTAVVFVSLMWILGAYPAVSIRVDGATEIGSSGHPHLAGAIAVLVSVALFATGAWILM